MRDICIDSTDITSETCDINRAFRLCGSHPTNVYPSIMYHILPLSCKYISRYADAAAAAAGAAQNIFVIFCLLHLARSPPPARPPASAPDSSYSEDGCGQLHGLHAEPQHHACGDDVRVRSLHQAERGDGLRHLRQPVSRSVV